jgi:hypothetical protein
VNTGVENRDVLMAGHLFMNVANSVIFEIVETQMHHTKTDIPQLPSTPAS